MLYSVKNVVEGFEEIDYNDGVRTLFLYTDGEYGGSPELKRLLTYIKHSTAENAADEELKTLHAMIEQIKGNSEIGVKYMHVREMMADTIKDAIDKGMKQGIEQGIEQGREFYDKVLEIDVNGICESLIFYAPRWIPGECVRACFRYALWGVFS